jgi:glycosyltransferase involved in cell wall biosynthesis
LKSSRKERVKILFLIDELLVGGTENQLILFAENLPRDSFDPIIGVLRKTDYQDTLKIKTPIVDFKWSGIPLTKNLSLLWRIKNYLDRERFDILQTYFADSTIYGAWAARLCRNRPYLIATRRNLYHWKKDEPLTFRLLRHTVKWTDWVLVNSHSALKECGRMENIPQDKVILIPNAIEAARFNGIPTDEAKQAIGLTGEFPVIGVVANFRPVKGLLSFLEAAAKVHREIPSAQFVLVGSGPQEGELKARCSELGIQDRVKFLTDCPKIPTAMAGFDVAVQPSLSESFSNVLLEYMAASKPIVATRVGDTEVIIQDGAHGLLVQPNDPQGLASAILWLSRNLERALEMGRLAREKAIRDWSSEKIIRAYEALYERVIENRH